MPIFSVYEEFPKQNHAGEVLPQEREEVEQQRIEVAVDFLLNSNWSGIFYQGAAAAYLIPVAGKFGYQMSFQRKN